MSVSVDLPQWAEKVRVACGAGVVCAGSAAGLGCLVAGVQYYICLRESACEYECECSGWRYLMTNVCFDCCTIVGRACARESELLGGPGWCTQCAELTAQMAGVHQCEYMSLYLSLCLSIGFSIYRGRLAGWLDICVSLCLCLCFWVSVCLCLWVCLSVCLSLCLSVSLSVSLSLYLSLCL